MQELLKYDRVCIGNGNMCMQGMLIKTPSGDKQPALKATGWMTNAQSILSELAVICSNDGSAGDHPHASLAPVRAAAAAVYPEFLT